MKLHVIKERDRAKKKERERKSKKTENTFNNSK